MKAFASWLVAPLASLIWLSSAAGQEPAVQLIWERPPGSLCPSRAVLEADVEAEMGRRVFGSAEDARVILRGDVHDGSDGVRVRLEARSREGALLGTRELSAEAGECAALRGAIGLVLTLLVERDDGSLAHGDGASVHFGVGPFVDIQSLPLPRASLSFGAAFALEIGSVLRLQLDAAYWVPVVIETPSGVGATLQALSVGLRACVRFWGDRSSFGLALCAGAHAGPLISSPRMLEGAESQVRLLAQGLLELRWEANLEDFASLNLAVGPLLSFSRPSYSYVRADNMTMDVYRPQLGGIIFQIAFIILGS
ncbi:MAG TPA: hypothetical protein VJV78_01985 [Polyangiales bacterium]|nr:hypothetical protein [Polyangiales bacterium]